MILDILRQAGCEAVRAHAPLCNHTTFRVGGPCRALARCRDAESMIQAVRALVKEGARFTVIGSGSNLLVSDLGWDGIILCFQNPSERLTWDGLHVQVSGGTLLDSLVHESVEMGLDGLTFASGLPGTIGGALAGNAGAFGECVSDRLVSLSVLDAAGHVREVSPDECGFCYRNSTLAQNREIVLRARFALVQADRTRLHKRRADMLTARRERHPDWRRIPTAGSFFRNLDPERPGEPRRAAGWFLEQAGAKALRVGGAGVWPSHANIIVGGAGCMARDIYELAQQMAGAVRKQFDIELRPEVRFLGDFRKDGDR